MKVKCIKEHYSPNKYHLFKKGEEYEYTGVSIQHGVIYIKIKREDREFDTPAKYFWTTAEIRNYKLKNDLIQI